MQFLERNDKRSEKKWLLFNPKIKDYVQQVNHRKKSKFDETNQSEPFHIKCQERVTKFDKKK